MKENDIIENKEIENDGESKEKKGNFFKDWIIPIFCAIAIAVAINLYLLMFIYQVDQ